jgi:two-component system, NtrC family, sensor histidine kinase PilS
MSGTEPRRLLGPEATVRVRLSWLMLFRAVVVAALLVSVVAIRFGSGDNIFGTGSQVVFGACAVSYASILAGALWLSRTAHRDVIWVAHLQLAWDAVFATALAFVAGGTDSAFVFLYFLTILVAASLVGRRGTIVVASESALLYGLLLIAELSGFAVGGSGAPTVLIDAVPGFLTNVLGMFLIAILAGYLTEQLRRTSESLTEARVHLLRLEELHAAVLQSLPSGVLTVDDAGTVVYVNAAGTNILGHRPGELVGQNARALLPELPIASGVGPGPGREGFELELEQSGASRRIIGGSIAGLTGLESIVGHVVVFQDLTELRRLQRDIAHADRLATVGRFAAGLAHEVRNPLAAMIGCLELLEADMKRAPKEQGTEDERMLGIVHREAKRLSNLVSAFLTYARPKLPALAPTGIAALIDETVAAAKLGEPGSELDVRLVASPTVTCDGEQIRQVLWNLVGNAVSMEREDARGPPRARVTLDEEDGSAVISVEDDGPGVPAALRERIFEPFFTTRPSGTGLGLATCYQIVDAHGGAVTVGTSDALGGAHFTVRLPLEAAPRRDMASEPALPILRQDLLPAHSEPSAR